MSEAVLEIISPQDLPIIIDMPYATHHNITARPIYQAPVLALHPDAAQVLRQAVKLAAQAGLQLKVFDGYRPAAAQWQLWHALPDATYVKPPQIGSNHTRGVALDLTLVDANGQELDMGTGFDSMETASHHFAPDLSAQVYHNRLLLIAIMAAAGMQHLATEWWHYELPNALKRYPLIDSEVVPTCTYEDVWLPTKD
nr:D-alanyl-D-alanine dipeptidase [Brackiella oedipodis]